MSTHNDPVHDEVSFGAVEEELLRAFGAELAKEEEPDPLPATAEAPAKPKSTRTRKKAAETPALGEMISESIKAHDPTSKVITLGLIEDFNRSIDQGFGKIHTAGGYTDPLSWTVPSTPLSDQILNRNSNPKTFVPKLCYNFSPYFKLVAGEGKVAKLISSAVVPMPEFLAWPAGISALPFISLQQLNEAATGVEVKEEEAKEEIRYLVAPHFQVSSYFVPLSLSKAKVVRGAKKPVVLDNTFSAKTLVELERYVKYLSADVARMQNAVTPGEWQAWFKNEAEYFKTLELLKTYYDTYSLILDEMLKDIRPQAGAAPEKTNYKNEVPIIDEKIAAMIDQETFAKEVKKSISAQNMIDGNYFRTVMYWGTIEPNKKFVEDLQRQLDPLGAKVKMARKLLTYSFGAYSEAEYMVPRAVHDYGVLKNLWEPTDLPLFTKDKTFNNDLYMAISTQLISRSSLMYLGTPYLVEIEWETRTVLLFCEYAESMYGTAKALFPADSRVLKEWRPVDPQIIMYVGNCGWCERNVSPKKSTEGKDYHSPYVNQKTVLEWLTNSFAVRLALEGNAAFADRVVLGANTASKNAALDDFLKSLGSLKEDLEAKGVKPLV